MDLIKKIENYKPFDEQEKKDKELFLKYMNYFDNLLTRENEFAHFTASSFVLNQDQTKMLVVHHNIYDAWIYPGGHADGISDLLKVAVREVLEETNIKAKILDNSIFSIQSLPTKGHIKNGIYVPAHTHLDCVYLLEANDSLELSFRFEESKGVKWISLDKTDNNDMVDFIRPINKKLIKKLKNLY